MIIKLKDKRTRDFVSMLLSIFVWGLIGAFLIIYSVEKNGISTDEANQAIGYMASGIIIGVLLEATTSGFDRIIKKYVQE